MLTVGLTGGIGAGKTVCARIFEHLGVPLYISDDRAKSIMVSNEKVISSIKTIFGEESYSNDGQLNRKYLAGQIFTDRKKLTAMNQVVHPAVRDDFASWCLENQDHPYIIQESALLFETGSYQMFDKIIVVVADDDIRIQRVMSRDNIDEASVKARIDKQLPQEQKQASADFVIFNNGVESIIKQVIDIHILLLDKAKETDKDQTNPIT